MKQFKLGVISDEITQNFEHALEWIQGFGLEWVELRFVWDKYVTDFTADDVKRAKDLLAKYGMRVSVLDSPYFKTLLPGTHSKFAEAKPDPLQSDFSQQNGIFRTGHCPSQGLRSRQSAHLLLFARADDPKTVFDPVAKELERTAAIAHNEGIRLVLENEFSCNVATGAESAAMLSAVKSSALGLNWDPGNAYDAGETPFPNGYEPLDKKRIWHMHFERCGAESEGRDGVDADWKRQDRFRRSISSIDQEQIRRNHVAGDPLFERCQE